MTELTVPKLLALLSDRRTDLETRQTGSGSRNCRQDKMVLAAHQKRQALNQDQLQLNARVKKFQ